MRRPECNRALRLAKRTTSELTPQNSRVKWWAVAQIGLLLAMCAWNVHYLKSWFEVKRVL